MKRTRIIIWLCFAVFMAVTLLAWKLQPKAEAVALAACAERGLPADRLLYAGFEHDSGVMGFGGRHDATVVVKGSKPLKQVRVTLRRPVYFLPWRVVDYEKVGER